MDGDTSLLILLFQFLSSTYYISSAPFPLSSPTGSPRYCFVFGWVIFDTIILL